MSIRLGGDRKAPENRLRERIFDGLLLLRIRAARTERLVALDEHHLRSDTMERDDAALPATATIEADVIRAKSRRQPGREEELGVETRYLHEQSAGSLVPVEREISVELARARRSLLDARRRA